MKRTPLPSAKWLRDHFTYDPATGILRGRVRRSSKAEGAEAGYLHSSGYRRVKLEGRDVPTHRIVWKMMTGAEPPDDIDHHNLERSDNRWENLREATRTLNRCNTRARRDNKIGLKGVSRDRTRWRAQITVGGVHHFLGNFLTPEAAHAAYSAAAERLHGPFARTA